MTPSSRWISWMNESSKKTTLENRSWRSGGGNVGKRIEFWFWIRAISDVVYEHDASLCRLIARCTRRRRRCVQRQAPTYQPRSRGPIGHRNDQSSFDILSPCWWRAGKPTLQCNCSCDTATTVVHEEETVVFHAPNQLAERASSLVPRAFITP